MTWMLLVALVWFAVCSAETTSKLPDDILNNLAALQSAENILVNIDDLTSVAGTSTPPVVAAPAVSKKKSTKPSSKITPTVNRSGRRFGAAPAESRYNSDIKGLEVLYEMKRRIQKHVQNMMQADASTPASSLRLIDQYEDPKLISYPYYGLPSRFQAAHQPINELNPLAETKNPEEYAKQLNDLKLLAAFADYTHPVPKPHEQNFVFRQAPVSPPQPEPRGTPPSRVLPGLRPKTTAPASKTIPEWMLLELAEIRRARRPMDSPSLSILPGQPISLSNVEKFAEITTTISEAEVEAAFLEARAKMLTRPGWREPQPPFPTSFTPVPILPARPLLPQRPMLAVSLPPLPLVSNPPKKFSRTARPRAASRLPPAITSNRYKVVSAANNIPSEKLLKLMAFMRENREALLQFIALKRNQLLKGTMNGAEKGATRGGNGLNDIGRTSFLGRSPVMEALIHVNGANSNAFNSGKGYGRDKGFGLAKGLTASGVSASQPVVRALPADYPAQRLDLAPGRGRKIEHLRFRDRLCQRNVMLVAGPKYDSRANVKTREFLPGVDGRAFRVTRRKRLLLPACCNCCKKSVLGCQ